MNQKEKIILEKEQLFSQSMLWDLQRSYYENKGTKAWSDGEIPYYVTSNSLMGKAYAEMVIAFLEDLAKDSLDTVYLLELGSGHGRFAFNFMKHFSYLYEQHTTELPKLCYVLSDFTEKNLSFLQEHPQFKSYIQDGVMDACLFDIESSEILQLRNSAISIGENSLTQPLIVVANYVLDTIAQDLFYINKKEIYNSLISIAVSAENYDVNKKIAPEELFIKYKYEKITDLSDKPVHVKLLLENYLEMDILQDSHLLFPTIGIDCLERLRRFSPQGLMLLTSDKGDHRLRNEGAPILVPHGDASKTDTRGCFSFSVNYNVFKKYCENSGGQALFSDTEYYSLDTGCLLFSPSALKYKKTISTYDRSINCAGPDMLNYISDRVLQSSPQIKDILYLTRLNWYDPYFFTHNLPFIYANISQITEHQRSELLNIAPSVWDMYYILDSKFDLAYDLGLFLYTLKYYNEALYYLKQSPDMKEVKVQEIILGCYYQLKDFDNAIALLKENQS